MHQSRFLHLAPLVLVTALGGFLFGYDTAVINGAFEYLRTHFALDPTREGFAGASAIFGCIPGAMLAGFLSDRFGRKRVLFLCGMLYAVSGLFSAIPRTFIGFLAARCISGLGIGASSMICPVYIAEIAPKEWRGRLGSLFQLGIVTGIFLTLFINLKIQGLGDATWNTLYGWRWMLGMEVLPAIAFIAMLFTVPESPRWLLANGKVAQARSVLMASVQDELKAEQELRVIQDTLNTESCSLGKPWKELLFSFKGRATRATFWGISLLNALMLLVVALLSFGLSSELDATRFRVIALLGVVFGVALIGIWAVVALWIRVAVQVRRWHDLDFSGWMVLVGFVPIVGWIAAVWLGFVKGTEGTNKFGETEEGLFGELFNRRFRRPLIIAVLLMAFSQFCGINAIIYYSTKIFAAAGVGVNDAFTSSAAIGFVNLLFTFVAIALVDKARRLPLVLIGLAVLVVAAGVAACMLLAGVHGVRLLMTIVVFFAAFATVAIALADKAGRRPLLLIGLAVQVAALGAVGWMFHTGARGMGLLVAVISFTAAFAMAMGPISWILCSEIFPTKVRGRAMSVATFTIWTSCYIVAQTFPMLNDNPAIGPAKTFGVYALCSLASFVFVLAMVPETKGRSLEEIESSWHAATGKQDHARD